MLYFVAFSLSLFFRYSILLILSRFQLYGLFLFSNYLLKITVSLHLSLWNNRLWFVLHPVSTILYIFLTALNLSKIYLTSRFLTSFVTLLVQYIHLYAFVMDSLVSRQRRLPSGYDVLIDYVFVAGWDCISVIFARLRRLMIHVSGCLGVFEKTRSSLAISTFGVLCLLKSIFFSPIFMPHSGLSEKFEQSLGFFLGDSLMRDLFLL
jgi:hypothetical protein